MLKGVLISVLPMVVVAVVVKMDAHELPEGNLVCVFGMGVERDVRWKTAQKVRKAFLVSASLMEVVGDVSIPNALRELKEAQCSARPMVVANVALIQGAIRVQKVAPPSAKAMGEENGVHSKVVEFAQRVCMEGPFSVWHMEEEKGVLFQSVKRVPGDGQTSVFVMAVARDADLKGVGKVLKEALISARLMVEERDALGVTLLPNLVMETFLAIHFLEAKWDFVPLMVPLFWIKGFTVEQL